MRGRSARIGGVSDIAHMLGVTRQQVANYRRQASFPRPLNISAGRALFDLDAVQRWKDALGKNPGRPRRDGRHLLGGRFLAEQAILDSGGQGKVRRAIDLAAAADTAQVVALKLVDGADQEMRRRVLREYGALADHPHPHVIPVIAVGEETDGTLWYAMPLARQSLERRLESGVLGADDALAVIRQVCLGIAHLHAVGVIHRDIKPGNVLETAPGRWVVSDLGLARRSEAETTGRLTESGAGFGTPWYTAPEQWSDAHGATERSDIFSMGRLTQQVLVGYESDLEDIEHDAIRAVLRRATESDPNARHASVDAFLGQLESAAGTPRGGWALPEPWADQRERLIRDLGNVPLDPATLEELRSLMSDAVDDADLLERYESVFTELPSDVITELWNDDRGLVRRFLEAYARHVDGVSSYDFAFTDHVADFWRRCVRAAGDPQVRGHALGVLGQLGPRYNRWHVRDVFTELLQEVQSADDAIYSEEPLRMMSIPDLQWSIGELDLRTLHPMLYAAITAALADGDEV